MSVVIRENPRNGLIGAMERANVLCIACQESKGGTPKGEPLLLLEQAKSQDSSWAAQLLRGWRESGRTPRRDSAGRGINRGVQRW